MKKHKQILYESGFLKLSKSFTGKIENPFLWTKMLAPQDEMTKVFLFKKLIVHSLYVYNYEKT